MRLPIITRMELRNENLTELAVHEKADRRHLKNEIRKLGRRQCQRH